MFDYAGFENDLVQQMSAVFNHWIEENHDLYIFGLDCERGMRSIGVVANTIHYLEQQADTDSEEYWYYKYCEEEWGLFDTFTGVSAKMQKYLEKNQDVFASQAEPYLYSEVFEQHCDEIKNHCKNALIRFRTAVNKNHSEILLTFQIREYLDSDEKAEWFQLLNSEAAAKEYLEHREEFESCSV